MNNDAIQAMVEFFHPVLRTNILKLMTEKLGVSSQHMRINIERGGAEYERKFRLEVPYAGKRLKWDVFFEDDDYTFAPDFEFVGDTFLSDPDLETVQRNLKQLASWDVTNCDSLLRVIREIFELYKKFQVQKLETEAKLNWAHINYERIKCDCKLDDNDLEVYVDQDNAVHILVAFRQDFLILSPHVPSSYFGGDGFICNIGDDIFTLRIVYTNSRYPSVGIIPSIGLLDMLEDHMTLQVAAPNSEDSSIVDYIFRVREALRECVISIHKCRAARETFVNTILAIPGLDILEYDAVSFKYIGLLLNDNNSNDKFHCYLHIALGPKFPEEHPITTLMSIYEQQNGEPIRREFISKSIYNPRSKPKEIVKCLLKQLPTEITNFRQFIRMMFKNL